MYFRVDPMTASCRPLDGKPSACQRCTCLTIFSVTQCRPRERTLRRRPRSGEEPPATDATRHAMHSSPWACSKSVRCCSAFAVLTTIVSAWFSAL